MGRAHGVDGSFYVDGPEHPLPRETPVAVGGGEHHVVERGGSERRPLVRLSGIDGREAAAALHGEPLLVEAELERGEWLAVELVGREVRGFGRVTRVLDGPSCDVLELEDGTLVPFIEDAIVAIGDAIEVDRDFLGL